jgi:hypothetical protein
MRARSALLLLLAAWAHPYQAEAQTFELVPEARSAHVGDPIPFRATVRLDSGQALIDVAPHPLLPPGDGIALLTADTLRPARDGSLQGRVRLAFYRTGLQPVPTLALLYRRNPAAPPETLVHRSVAVEIVPVLPAGSQEIKDIKGLVKLGAGSWELGVGFLALIAVVLLFRRWWRAPEPAQPPTPPPEPRDAYDEALAALAAIEREQWPSRGEVARHYEAASQILRRCLAEATTVPSLRATTPEIVSGLPPALAFDGQRDRCRSVLTAADLVKFARVRPDPESAAAFLREIRLLLTQWQDAATGSEPADAIR